MKIYEDMQVSIHDKIFTALTKKDTKTEKLV